jgi:uncharacterized membrane protein YbaN (DUF454 family)
VKPEPSEHHRLSLGARVLLLAGGWLLLLVGIAGLFLPGIQGLLAIALALALLSAGSQRVHGVLRRLLQRWPRLWHHIEEGRKRVHRWLGPREEK